MSNSIEKTAKTVEEAIDLAISELKVDRSAVDIEVMNEGKVGIFGFIGNKLAKVKVTVRKSTALSRAEAFVREILDKMGVNGNVEVSEDGENIDIMISGENVGIIIGRRGETLDAIQYLTGLVINKENETHYKVMIDVESYRSKREQTLIVLAKKLEKKVLRTRKSVTLEPMTAYERRVIHSALQESTGIVTYSVGAEPYRKIVIKPK